MYTFFATLLSKLLYMILAGVLKGIKTAAKPKRFEAVKQGALTNRLENSIAKQKAKIEAAKKNKEESMKNNTTLKTIVFFFLLIFLITACAFSNLFKQTIFIKPGTPVQIAEPMKAKVWVLVKDQKGNEELVLRDFTIPAGWWALPDPDDGKEEKGTSP